jgi:hypothetical protein
MKLPLVIVISFFNTAHGTDVRVIEVAFGGLGRPFSYLDENNEIQGLEADILRAIDELIPEYSFHFNAMERDAETSGWSASVSSKTLPGDEGSEWRDAGN